MTKSPTNFRDKKAAERRRRKIERIEREKLAAEKAARTEEERAEKIAPAAQRHDVISNDGSVIRVARVERDGVAFRVANPIAILAKRGAGREEAGEMPMIRAVHVVAAERLALAWEEGGRGVGIGASNYGERSGGGTTTTGSPSDATLSAMAYQNQRRTEFLAAKKFLGSLWGIIEAVALHGMDVTAWATRERTDRRAAVGFLAAALNRLVEFYETIDKPRRASRIQAATVVPREIGEAA